MRKLLGTCVCGGSSDRPNPDCERCDLIQLAKEVLCALYDIRRRRIDDGMAADDLATAFSLPRSDVRRVVGLPDEEGGPS